MDDSSKLVAQDSIPIDPGKQSPKNARRWLRQQIPYRNFAGISESLDAKAAAFVFSRREQFRNRMSGPMRRWAVNWAAANTEVMWQERPDDIHMPEVKKALDAKAARIEEAITSFDPVFEAEGTNGDLSRMKAKVIGQYVYRKMELADWRRFVQPVARDGELCNIMAMKVTWDQQFEEIVERDDELTFRDDDTPRYETSRYMRRGLVYRGIRLSQVDPFWFIYDLEADSPQNCAYIGDESTPFLHELEAMAEQGIYSKDAVERVRKGTASDSAGYTSDNTARTNWTDQLRRARIIALGPDFSRDVKGEHGAVRVRLIEMWAWFDFGDGIDGVTSPRGGLLKGTQRVVITVANGIVIRIQQNPFDRKFVPYAVSMINRNGHELVAPAPFDAVVQANANYDRLSSNIMRWMDLIAAPVVITADTNADLPDTLLDVEAGKILRGVGQWDWIKAPDITSAVGYFQQFWRREMEETSGALRVFESPQGTATETERKVQEQQRMVRNSIRAGSDLWRQVALLTKAYEAQFSTGIEQFAVSGKASQVLGKWASITPDMLLEDCDFRFLGLTDIHVFGNRLQGMSQWMQRWGPMLPNMPQVNLNALCRLDFELSVGRTSAGEIFPEDAAPWETWDQSEENAMLVAGMAVPVNQADDDEAHMKDMIPLIEKMAREKAPKYVMDLMIQHWQAHAEQMQRKLAEQKKMQEQQMQNQGAMEMAGGTPGKDRSPVAGGLPASGMPDITPGPPQARTVARTGREGAGISQTQVMR